ncbi:MAG: 30S ribosomal protein S16 [Proteobacteria bacterium]|nr:30S ribosomal protein S16 [Pseudomonadota bacterium]
MLKVRLARRGAKKRPYYHVVVANSESPRDGKFVEQIGTYDPARPMSEARINGNRLEYWLGHGAQMTRTAGHVIKEALGASSVG